MRLKQQLCLSAALAMLLMTGACSNDSPDTYAAGKGRIAVQTDLDATVSDVVPPTRASQASVIPAADELNLKLSKADGSYAESWSCLADFPEDKEFPKGAYTLEAFYGAIDTEGFDSPYYYGSADVNVEEGQTAETHITATLANDMVSIDYTDAFRSYFTAYSTQVHAEGGEYVSFTSDETRPAYLRPGQTTVTISVTKQNGLAASIQAAEFEAQARHHYHITLDVNDGETGQGVIVVKFDDSIVTEDVTIDVSDQALLTPAPTVTTSGFTDSEAINTDELTPMQQAMMTLNAPGGLSSVVLTVKSESLISQGFPAEIDLMKATEAQQALLASLGLQVRGLYSKPDKMAVIDFANVTDHITGSGNHTFTVVAKDRLSKVNTPVTLSVNTRAVNTQVVEMEDIRIDQTSAYMKVSYDGADFASKVKLQIQNDGSWHNAVITDITPLGNNTYGVSFNVPADYSDFPIGVEINGRRKATATLHKSGVILTPTSQTDVWATHATFKVTKNEAVKLSDITYYFTAGSTYSQAAATVNSDGTVTLSGLTPGSTLTLKASDTKTEAGAYKTCTVTTEAALQLPNADMESWYEVSGASNWSTWYAGDSEDAVWGTNNPMTSSQGGNFAYCRISGTTRNSDHTNGSYSAIIRTVGWGSGNTAIGSTSGVCKYVDAGLLHLGPSRHDREDAYDASGIQFASRPSALTFQYKYIPKNTEDYGNVLVVVYDASGNKIAEGSKNLTAVNAFGLATVPLNYSVKNKKAAKIYVKFVSTVESRFLVKTELNAPAFGGSFGKATWMGSQLYVDGLSLTY